MRRAPTLLEFLSAPKNYPEITGRPAVTTYPRAPQTRPMLSADNRYQLRQDLQPHVAQDPGPTPFPFPVGPPPRVEPPHVSPNPNDLTRYATFADYANEQESLLPPRRPLPPDVVAQNVGLLPGNGSGVHNDAAVAAGGAGALQLPQLPSQDASDLMRALAMARRGVPNSIQAQANFPGVWAGLSDEEATLAARRGRPVLPR